MNQLSTLLADIESSVAKVKSLESELATEKQRGQSLAEKYRIESGEVLKALGVVEPAKERKARSQDVILLSAANRAVKQMTKAGEKNTKKLLAGALEAAEQSAKKKFALSELPADIKTQIEQKLNAPPKK